MLCPPVCYSCGLPIGIYADIILDTRRRLLAAEIKRTGTKPEYAAFDMDIVVNLGPILDNLRVHRECCRGILMSFQDSRETP